MSSPTAYVLVACAAAVGGAWLTWLFSRILASRALRNAVDAGVGDASRRPVALAAAPAPTSAARISQDVSQDLERQEAELTQRRQALEAAERFRNRLISQLSHEVRTPLNSIITLSHLLQDGSTGPVTPDQRKYLEVIHRSGANLLAIINDVLDLSHIEAGRLELEIGAVDVRALIRGVAAASEERARSKGLPLNLNPPRAQMLVRADDDRLRQVLDALVAHAIQETVNGYIEVSAEADQQQVTIRVSDTGMGTTPELHRATFDELLTRNNGAAAPEPGLILADRLVKLMGGSITVDSAAGEGTTVAISLARSTASAPTRSSEETAAPSAPRLSTPAHVLLIEDDEIERQRIGALLQGAGYRVSPASSGQDGLNQLREGRFDGVVLDLVMPGMTGLDVLRAARTDERLSTIPFIVLSALYMTRSERDVLGPTVVAVVRKGEGTNDELLAQLGRAMAGKSPAAAAPNITPLERLARVLLIEDDDDNLFAIEQVLSALPVSIQTAMNGQQAIEICRRHPPDLILMDVELPGMSGVEVSEDIRRLPDCGDVPIIALSAAKASGDGRHALAVQCSAYLSKPVKPGEVVNAVTRALQLGIH